MNALGALGVVVSNTVGPDPSTFAASIAYADSAGEPGDAIAYGEFFTLLDATQFVVTQAWVLAITREREYLAATIVRGGPCLSGHCPVSGRRRNRCVMRGHALDDVLPSR